MLRRKRVKTNRNKLGIKEDSAALCTPKLEEKFWILVAVEPTSFTIIV